VGLAHDKLAGGYFLQEEETKMGEKVDRGGTGGEGRNKGEREVGEVRGIGKVIRG